MSFIIFISPSKTFAATNIEGTSQPLFLEKTLKLQKKLQSYTAEDLTKLMSLSPKLAAITHQYYQRPTMARAINLYSGVSYKAMDSQTFTVDNHKLYILDAYYGLIRPSDHIRAYRLDFTMRFLGNLYEYWQSDIANYLHKAHHNDTLVDLCSHEFSPLLAGQKDVIRIDFVLKDKKISNVLLKQMRGKMARYIVDHNINDVLSLKSITLEGFTYCLDQSTTKTFIFAR